MYLLLLLLLFYDCFLMALHNSSALKIEFLICLLLSLRQFHAHRMLIFFFYSDTSIFHYLSIFALESRPYTAKQAKIVIKKPGKFSQNMQLGQKSLK